MQLEMGSIRGPRVAVGVAPTVSSHRFPHYWLVGSGKKPFAARRRKLHARGVCSPVMGSGFFNRLAFFSKNVFSLLAIANIPRQIPSAY
jgi:hypothetical protein